MKKRTNSGSGWDVSSSARAGMLMGVARCLDSQLLEGLVGLWGQVVREWAPLQKEQICNNLHDDESQPWSLKLLHIILDPTNSSGRPLRSLVWEEAGKVVGRCALDFEARGRNEVPMSGWAWCWG